MAFIKYIPEEHIPEANRVPDKDNIIQIHSIHSKVMRQHYELYIEIMRKKSPLSRMQREMIAVTVSGLNKCRY
ncbi:MAG: hypothetical protein ACE5GL_05285 [Calditrichia bacterium]